MTYQDETKTEVKSSIKDIIDVSAGDEKNSLANFSRNELSSTELTSSNIGEKKFKWICLLLIVSVLANIGFTLWVSQTDPLKGIAFYASNWAVTGAIIDFANLPTGKEKNNITGILKLIPALSSAVLYSVLHFIG